MEKEFVPYELALKLKELGFNEQCFAGYRDYGGIKLMLPANKPFLNINDFGYKEYSKNNNHVIKAPLWQQAFDWFREKYNHSGEVYFYSSADFGKWHFDIEPLKLDGERFTTPVKEGFETYSLARLACLEKLISYHK